jgi:hypothetical protein
MTTDHSVRGLLHRATHRVPGVPAHADQPAGHHGKAVHGTAVHGTAAHSPAVQGTRVHGRARRRGATRPSLNHRWNHSPARPHRFMPAWQRRIAAFFGLEP